MSYTVDENGFIKLAATRQQMLALHSIPVASRRPSPTTSVKRMPTIYELKQNIAGMSPAQKSQNRARVAKEMGIEFTGGMSHFKPDAPKTRVPVGPPADIVGLTDYGTKTSSFRLPLA